MADESVDLESVPNQVGTAVLNRDGGGTVVKCTGSLSEDGGANVCAHVYQMLLDTSVCLDQEPLRRMSILFSDHNYVVTLGDKHIYIVQLQG
jgi:ragulator complex protein LAMTOR4